MPNNQKGLAKRLFSNWPAKVISLAAALLLFAFYRVNKLEDRFISVPLAVSMNDEYVPSTPYPRSVRATLRGESNDLFSIQEDDIQASLDLSAYHAAGVYRVPVQIQRKGSALGMDPLEIRTDPVDISITMEKRVTRTVPITPSFKGFLEPGYELISFELAPSQLDISGPASAVARIGDVQTDFIELAGRNTDFIVKTRIVKKDSLVTFSGGDSIEFRAVVQKSLAIRSFEDVPLAAQGLSSSLVLDTPLPKGSIRIRSSTADLSSFSPDDGILFVDLSSLRKSGSYQLKVQSRAPDGFTIERFEPQTVQVTVSEALR